MSLGLGQSKDRSYSESTSDAYGYSQSESQDVSRSFQDSVSGGTSGSSQAIAFAPIFEQLFSGASKAGQGALLGANEITRAATQLFTGGSKFMEGLGGDVGTQYLADRVTGDNPVLQQNIDLLREDAGRLFSEQLNPAITSRAVAGGNLGGGRQGVAQGLATEAVTREFVRGSTALRTADQAQRDAAAGTVASNSLAAASTGLGALPGLLDLLERGNSAELGIFSNLSSILGGPTTLTTSSSDSFSRSTAQSVAEAFSRAFGENTSASRAGSHARGDAWNFSAAVGPSGG